ncbi:NAD(P)/FAD-dependent oxidoreductase [Cryptosporangium japonicum]|uniref:ArsO family NAD(P)H-dependent flavin-containing monooxygenase n=1 Tax=Cryptosporangium japonicum TaxID=80872 RepID=A0ABN0U391_9ACTN
MIDCDALVIGAGQAGLAAARALRRAGRTPIVLEAGDAPVGSWPSYYASLTLFSPARYSALPGMPFPGDPDRYPHRDEVIGYLRDYAERLGADIRLGDRASTVTHDGTAFTVAVAGQESFRAPLLIAATGGFGTPHRPVLPGLDRFTGTLLHSADYRTPAPFAGQRVVVVGSANTAVQIGAELAAHARVTLASRHPVRLVAQRPLGRDVHFWFRVTGFDTAPIGPLPRTPAHTPVLDDGRYLTALASGNPDQRPVFTGIDGERITWADGTAEHVDTIILATGYRPNVSYLQPLGVLDTHGTPLQRRGLSTTHPGLGYVGLEWQRSFASATLRGAARDAHYVTRRLHPR